MIGFTLARRSVCLSNPAALRRGVSCCVGVALNLDALIPAHQAALLAKVSRQVIYRWRTLGHLEPAAERKGRPLYRVGDVLEAERITRRSPRSHRYAA